MNKFILVLCLTLTGIAQASEPDTGCPRSMSRVGDTFGAAGRVISYFFTLPMDTLLLLDDNPKIYVLTRQNSEWLAEEFRRATKICVVRARVSQDR